MKDNDKEILEYAIKAVDLITELHSLPVDSLLVIKQAGYYAVGDYAAIYRKPLYIGEVDGKKIYSIGDSEQSY